MVLKQTNITELLQTIHSKQNEIDEMRANQEALQDNYVELANAYNHLQDRVQAIEDYQAAHKGKII